MAKFEPFEPAKKTRAQAATAWHERALCTFLIHQDAWFPDGKFDYETTLAAIRVCDACPVAQDCLQYAAEWEVTDGVWGGLLLVHGVETVPEPPVYKRSKKGAA